MQRLSGPLWFTGSARPQAVVRHSAHDASRSQATARRNRLLGFLGLVLVCLLGSSQAWADPLEETALLDWEGDLAARLVQQADAFLLNELKASVSRRESLWKRDFSSVEAYQASISPGRERLAHLMGIRDPRVVSVVPRLVLDRGPKGVAATGEVPARIGFGNGYQIYDIRWPVLDDLEAAGLLLVPTDREPIADIVAIPDCEVLPEQLVGLLPGVSRESQYARRLAEAGCRVVVPLLINRQRGQFDWGPSPAPAITNREMLYRSAFELGRGLVGYEVQKIQAALDWFASTSTRPMGLIGWGEGGLLALYTGAIDTRPRSVVVSGYFDARENLWQEPIDRNIFGLLEQFGDAELAAMIAPRSLIIEASRGPEATLAGDGGAPARIVTPALESVRAEWGRAVRLVDPLKLNEFPKLTISGDGRGPAGTNETLQAFLQKLNVNDALPKLTNNPTNLRGFFDPAPRHRDQMRQLDRHTQVVLSNSGRVRQEFLSKLETNSPEVYLASAKPYRKFFAEEVIGRYSYPLVAPRPRTRQVYETDRWRGYEVVLDVFENIYAYGVLLVPKDLQPGEQRPVVVCQHGLEGRPQDTIGVQGSHYYSGFAGALADKGYITFSPQNLYIGEDLFRTLQRKSYPLKKTLFSIIVPQHQQIVDWLQTLPMVDDERIAFYGLSYGGKTAMRVPALVTDYCLSICSADFNEWVDKNASTTNPRSYVWTGEYEIFEFDLGSTFNYAEMAALIAPRPFMVERGHFDGVADDWTVGWEFAKVQNLYAARLKMPNRCGIHWFDGPHKINGERTYEFLDYWLSKDRKAEGQAP